MDIEVKRFEGKVLWYERGSSKHDSQDKCYFFAVAIQAGPIETDLFGNIKTKHEKIILQAGNAKKCFSQAQLFGLKLDKELYLQPTYEPDGNDKQFYFTTKAPAEKDGDNGFKYRTVVEWSFL